MATCKNAFVGKFFLKNQILGRINSSEVLHCLVSFHMYKPFEINTDNIIFIVKAVFAVPI